MSPTVSAPGTVAFERIAHAGSFASLAEELEVSFRQEYWRHRGDIHALFGMALFDVHNPISASDSSEPRILPAQASTTHASDQPQKDNRHILPKRTGRNEPLPDSWFQLPKADKRAQTSAGAAKQKSVVAFEGDEPQRASLPQRPGSMAALNATRVPESALAKPDLFAPIPAAEAHYPDFALPSQWSTSAPTSPSATPQIESREVRPEGYGRHFLRRLGNIACETGRKVKNAGRKAAAVAGGVALGGALAVSGSVAAHEIASIDHKTSTYYSLGAGQPEVTASNPAFRHDPNAYAPAMGPYVADSLAPGRDWLGGIAKTGGISSIILIAGGLAALGRKKFAKAEPRRPAPQPAGRMPASPRNSGYGQLDALNSMFSGKGSHIIEVQPVAV